MPQTRCFGHLRQMPLSMDRLSLRFKANMRCYLSFNRLPYGDAMDQLPQLVYHFISESSASCSTCKAVLEVPSLACQAAERKTERKPSHSASARSWHFSSPCLVPRHSRPKEAALWRSSVLGHCQSSIVLWLLPGTFFHDLQPTPQSPPGFRRHYSTSHLGVSRMGPGHLRNSCWSECQSSNHSIRTSF